MKYDITSKSAKYWLNILSGISYFGTDTDKSTSVETKPKYRWYAKTCYTTYFSALFSSWKKYDYVVLLLLINHTNTITIELNIYETYPAFIMLADYKYVNMAKREIKNSRGTFYGDAAIITAIRLN